MKPLHVAKVHLSVAALFFFLAAGNAAAHADTWTTKAPMPTPRLSPAAASVNGIVYVIGGGNYSCGTYSTVEAYDPATDTWTSKAPMPTPRYGLAAVAVNGIIYAMGGGGFCSDAYNRATVEAYDPATNTWTTKASMPSATRFVAADAVNGKIYLTDGGLSTVYIYDPIADSWSASAATRPPRNLFAVGGVGGEFYALGGYDYNGSSFVLPAGVYDPASDTWTTRTSPIPTPRIVVGGAAMGSKIYVVGGSDGTNQYSTANQAYDPATDTWTNLAAMSVGRQSLAVAAANGVLYAAGGLAQGNVPSNAMEAYTATQSDTIPPTTSAAAAPPPNGAGWNNTNVTVTLSATDNAGGSGVKSISYTIANGASGTGTTVNAATATLAISAEGVNTIGYGAADNAGNIEANKTLVVRLDKTPPVLSVPGTVTANASSPAGVAVSYTATASDNSGVAPAVSCSPGSGSVFPIGSSTVNCTATDAAGNSSSGSFSVVVNGPAAESTSLISTIQGFGLGQGTSTSLTSKLQSAVNSLGRGNVSGACSQLGALVNEAQAQSGKQLTAAQAAQIIAAATQIRAAEGCP